MRLPNLFYGLIAVALLSFSTQKKGSNTPGGWFFLADKSVGFTADHDVIYFGNWRDDVRQLKLKITEGPLKVYDMKIHFDNGTVQDVQLRNKFTQGSESRVIELTGGLRHLSKIEFWYETKGFKKGKSRVAVWAKN